MKNPKTPKASPRRVKNFPVTTTFDPSVVKPSGSNFRGGTFRKGNVGTDASRSGNLLVSQNSRGWTRTDHAYKPDLSIGFGIDYNRPTTRIR